MKKIDYSRRRTENMKITKIKDKIALIFLIAIFAAVAVPAGLSSQQEKNSKLKPLNKTLEQYDDEYSELDDAAARDTLDEKEIITITENARHYYLKALILIQRGDTASSAQYFEKALSELNSLVSYPGIEQDEGFSTLAQSIVDDYESFVQSIDEVDENSSLFIILKKLFLEVESLSTSSGAGGEDFANGSFAAKVISGEPPKVTIPLDDNEFVQRNIKFLTKKKAGVKFIKRCLQRSGKWFPLLKSVAKEEGLPEEIIYLAMIESALNPNAVSRAKAVGMWQFIRSTGMSYGLNKDASIWLDERRDPVKATRAAMIHLRDLYIELGDWHLALAAYNCGVHCVKRAIKRTKKNNPNFWDVRNRLPRETRNYVPSYIAVAKIIMNPQSYGFDLSKIEFEEEFVYDEHLISEPMSLEVAAKCAETTLDEIKELNPELVRDFTPPHDEGYRLRIPYGRKAKFIANYALLPEEAKQPWIAHVVQHRETLTKLANKYDVTAKEIADLNGLSSHRSRLRRGQTLRIPVAPKIDEIVEQAESGVEETSATVATNDVKTENKLVKSPKGETVQKEKVPEKSSESQVIAKNTEKPKIKNPEVPVNKNEKIIAKTVNRKTEPVYHKVRSGETLYSISKLYGIEISEIRALNDLEQWENDIKIGQELLISGGEVVLDASNKPIAPKIIKHKVKRGETLAKIADEYGVTIESIKKINRINRNRIYRGQILKIKTESGEALADATYARKTKIIHKVRRGETISSISAKYGVTESELKKWNPDEISGETIFRGSKLKIYSDVSPKGSSSSRPEDVNRLPKYYKVRSGETFVSIARKFGVPVESLLNKNSEIEPDELQIGQRIRIQ